MPTLTAASRVDTRQLLRLERQAMTQIVGGLPLPDVLDGLLRAVEAMRPGRRSSILMLGGEGHHLRHCAAPSLSTDFVAAIDQALIGPFDASVDDNATPELACISHIETDPMWEKWRVLALSHGLRSCWWFPIRASADGELGVLATYDSDDTLPTPSELNSVAFMAHTAGLVVERHRADAALHEREAQLQRLNAVLEESVRARTDELTALTRHLQTAQEEDRHRLALLLHDELGAVFTTAKMDGVRLKARMNGQPLATLERLQHLLDTLDNGIALKRRLIEELRPSALTNLGLVEALRILINDFARRKRFSITAKFDEMKLTPTVQLVAYRLIQEALTNVDKHASARCVEVTLKAADAQQALVSVSDDGNGFDVDLARPKAHGLTGLRYRIAAEGGHLRIASSPQGTQVSATLPQLQSDANFVMPALLAELIKRPA